MTASSPRGTFSQAELTAELVTRCIVRSYVGLAGFITLTWDFMVWPGWLVST